MRKYSKEFKEEALKLSDEIGVKSAASQLGIQYYTLAEWRKNRKAETKLPDPANEAACAYPRAGAGMQRTASSQ